MPTLTPEEFLVGIARITSFGELGIPNYTQTQWQALPPLMQISEALRIRNRGETLDMQVSNDHDWSNGLAWSVSDYFGKSARFGELKKKDYTFREFLEQVWVAELGDKGLAEFIKISDSVIYREPYFTNNLQPNLRGAWMGGKRTHSVHGPKLAVLVRDFKKKTGWKALPKIEATHWETDRALYPLDIFLKQRGFNLAR